MRRLAWILMLAAPLSGCTLGPLTADRHFRADRLEEAASAYQKYLERQPTSGRALDRTLYRLGLIHSLPESPLYDLEKARQLLSRLLERPSDNFYRRQASLVLALQLQVAELREAATSQALLSASLERELGRMEEEAAEASTVAGEQQSRAQHLATEIERLKEEIAELNRALDLREQELQRIKEIDLERLP